MNKKLQRQIEDVLVKINNITRHIRNVQDNCLLLGTKLIQNGQIELGKQLISNGFIHDVSKFYGIEFDNLSSTDGNNKEETKLKLKLSIYQHRRTNPHHAEYWNSIEKMPDVYLAELVCDLKARSEEFGTSLMDYINEEGIKRWGISKEHKIYKKIVDFVGLLCKDPFQEIK